MKPLSREGRAPGARGTFAVGAVVAIAAAAAVAWMFLAPGKSAPSAASHPSASLSGAAATVGAGRSKSAASASAGPCTSFSECGFPDQTNTGPRTPPQDPHTGNLDVRTDGEVIDGWDLHGSLDVYADNVTIEDSSIDSSNWWAVNLRAGHTGLRILHSALTGTPGAGPDNGGEDYAVSDMGSGSIEVGWDDVSVFGNALSMGNGFIHDSYVHDPVPFISRSGAYEHVDEVISDGDDSIGLTIEHNTLLDPLDIDHGPTSAVGLLPNTGPIQNTKVDDNWLAGGAYALYAGGDGATNVKVTRNVFSTEYWPQCGYYGAVAYWNAAGNGNVWSDNVFPSGVPVSPPTSD